jgi:streptogramin lyase/mono/diheme cytochrome c family protein
MRSVTLTAVAALGIFGMAGAHAAGITGTVTGPDGKPFRAAFVQARNGETKITVSVLSGNDGSYHIDDLSAGNYRLQIRAPGYSADAKPDVKLAASDGAKQDFALQKGPVQWADISLSQGLRLLPDERGKKDFYVYCVACHGFQSRMAAAPTRDEGSWRARMAYMRSAMGFFLDRPQRRLTDETADNIVHWMSQMWGEQSVLPESAADMTGYQETVRKVSDEALKIVYVEYEMPGPNRMPWSAVQDKEGKFWIPYYGRANKIGRLDAKTGVVTEYPVPNMGTAAIHSAVPAPDGTVWLTEQGANKLGKWDPKTQAITEYEDNWPKHTIRIRANGEVWSTGGLTRFDPKTEKFTHIPDVPNAYGIALDRQGNIWFAEQRADGRIGKVDAETLHVTKYQQPTKAGFPRRIQVDQQDGTVWFAEFQAGKLAQFDPSSGNFKEFPLPGPRGTPYAVGIGADRMLWYSSEWMDVVGRLDPATGTVTEYPIPQAENSMRDFFLDDKGRIWFGSPPNNRVGYFYLSDK